VSDPGTLDISSFTDQLLKDLIGVAKERDMEHQQEINTVRDNTSLVTKTPWLRYNRWDKKFAGQDMNVLHKLTDLPLVAESESEERIISESVARILNAYWEGFQDCMAREWDLIPFWLQSVVLEKEDTKPFRSYIAPYTLIRYIGYWQSYILLCWRMYNQQDERLEWTRPQRQGLIRLRNLMNGYAEDQSMELDEALLELSVSFICHSDYAKAPSSLIYYAGIRGYNVDYKQWRKPQDYTTILAGIQFCIRIIMLEHALPRESRNAFTEDSPMTPVMKFRQVRQWLIDGGGISR
jgi:hypothetical protein